MLWLWFGGSIKELFSRVVKGEGVTGMGEKEEEKNFLPEYAPRGKKYMGRRETQSRISKEEGGGDVFFSLCLRGALGRGNAVQICTV